VSPVISASRVATLVGDFDRSPAYAGLAAALRLLIGDGRILLGTRLPSERELTDTLAVSRTTVTRAYTELRDSGYAESRRGSGTFTRVPDGRRRALDNALLPYSGDEDAIDLNCAATSAPPGVAAAYADAVAELPAHLGGHGYFPSGLPRLQAAIAATYDARGLPTRPEQIMVTPGALTATAVVAQALTGPGDRVLVESPVYPNATHAIRLGGARIAPSPVDPDGWDLTGVGASLRQTRPKLAYLIADFQNPTGHLMTDAQRAEYADHLRATRTVAVVDEAHQSLALEGQEMPRPFASYAPGTISIGSASKSFWGGLRLGWIRADDEQMVALTRARVGFDLGAPVLEQLVLTRLLAHPEPILAQQRARLRQQRDRLAAAVTTHLPDWRFRLPSGGLALWCELPRSGATSAVAEAERRGVILAPGPVFAAEGGLDRFIRIPWTLPPDQLEEAMVRLASAWAAVGQSSEPRPRILVA
jgi:DNA-binding transcriptional MocR family regulator